MKVAICDDDQEFLAEFEKQVMKIKGVVSTDCFSEFDKVTDFIMAENYDIVFMDIDWGESESGLNLVQQLNENNVASKFVFVSGHMGDYVEEIFIKRLNISGILLKPVKTERLEECIWCIKKSLAEENEDYIYVKENGRKIVLSTSDIEFIESKDHYLDIHANNRKYHVPGKIKLMAEKLPRNFCRCHRGFIVNMNYVVEKSAVSIIMKDGVKIPVGRKFDSR